MSYTIVLNKLVHELPADFHLRTPCQEVPVPTEMVISQAGFYSPKMARVWNAYMYYYDGQIMTYQELYKAVVAKTGNFPGTSHFPHVLLVEVWDNQGDDGHTEFGLVGWRFVTDETLEKDIEKIQDEKEYFRYSGMPPCMGYCYEFDQNPT